MSKELPQPQQSEEVDLGQLFKLIGNMFDRLFKFIGGIFNKIFLAFVWFVFFVKKHFLKLVISGVIGIVLGYALQKSSDPVYKSYITIKQNYNTGENMYNSISYYNDLVKQKDFGTLSSILGLEEDQAKSILGFEIESVITENQKIKEFDRYLKTLDTTVAKTITYEGYSENLKDYNHQYQQIDIKSKERNNFKTVFTKLIQGVNNNPYFKREQEKDLKELSNRELALKEALMRSDSLQKTYRKVLESGLKSKNGSEIGITFEGSNVTDKTKEYDLYKNDLQLRDELVLINRRKADIENIIEVLSSKQDSGSIDDKKEVFGFKIGQKLFYGLLFSIATFMVLLGLQFVKFLEQHKNKI
ncbi:hypothetical protein [Seonamhaeicola marinus]|uniref:Uncharacterized protein n=1 Tax=Seonamhaeicola marinus TaxID=1912246 RepID=A0A5D0HXG4_9FLAO|nr:hypothetical protein [Seonamhaeicola marinus]TYA74142.1 hypothetical protein FUA24_12430 [Seonamhaeicola marinus]